jgi:hypothetical protein
LVWYHRDFLGRPLGKRSPGPKVPKALLICQGWVRFSCTNYASRGFRHSFPFTPFSGGFWRNDATSGPNKQCAIQSVGRGCLVLPLGKSNLLIQSVLPDGLLKHICFTSFQGPMEMQMYPLTKFFMWLVLVDSLNTRSMLLRRHYNVQLDAFCVLCNNNVEEDIEHLLFLYPFATSC